jgi:hypothetical protein
VFEVMTAWLSGRGLCVVFRQWIPEGRAGLRGRIYDNPVAWPSFRWRRKLPIFISHFSYILFASPAKNVVIIRRRYGSQTRRQKIAECLQTRQSQPIGTTLALSPTAQVVPRR